MDIKNQIQLKFHGVDFVDVHFTSHKAYRKTSGQKVDVNINPSIFYPQEHKQRFNILMDISVNAESFFKLKLQAIGNFEFNGSIEDKHQQHYINLNAPAIMFPYLRSFISTLTSNVGGPTGTITIPPQFFLGNLKEIDIEEFGQK